MYTQLLTILLIAAMKGTTGPKYYEKLMTLDQADQLEIAEVIQQVREATYSQILSTDLA